MEFEHKLEQIVQGGAKIRMSATVSLRISANVLYYLA